MMSGKNSNEKDSVVCCGSTEKHPSCSGTERKGKRLWKKVKYQLVEYHSLPAYLRDNEYIIGYYRSEWPMKQVLLSIFSIHNETLNVWTHLIGFFLFLSLTIYTAMKVPKVVDLHSLQHFPDMLKKADMHKLQAELLTCLPSMPDLHRLRQDLKTTLPSMDMLPSISSWHVKELVYNCLPERFSSGNYTHVCVLHSVKEDLANIIAPLMMRAITRWPFFAFLGGAMFCLLVSSVCHLVSCHSERLSYIMLRLDYAGIASLICTSFYPPVYYSFMCYPFFCNLYIGFITLLGIATTLVSLLPFFQKPQFRTFRASLFCGMGLCGIGPILHKLFLFWGEAEVFHTTGYETLMGLERLFMLLEFLKGGCLENSTLQDTAINCFMYWSLLGHTLIIVRDWFILDSVTSEVADLVALFFLSHDLICKVGVNVLNVVNTYLNSLST